jgi:hypothetical protein
MKALTLFCGVMIARIAVTTGAAQSHPFTVKDDIEMTRFSDPRPIPGVPASELAQRSPDGRHFAVVTTKGILQSDLLESRIIIFDTADTTAVLSSSIPRRINPRVIATLTSFPHHHEVSAYASVITDLRWTPDSSGVYYIGECLDGTYRLFLAKINGSTPVVLTPAGQSVTQYVIAGDIIVYREEAETSQSQTPSVITNADARAVTGESLGDILFSKELERYEPKISTMGVIKKLNGRFLNSLVPNSSIWQITFVPELFTPMAVSPNGRQVIELSPVKTMPTSWELYEPIPGFEHLRFHVDDPRLTNADNMDRPRRYTLVDLDDGKQQTLIDAPDAVPLGYGHGDNVNRIVWAKDGQRVLITNTFLPLDHVSDAMRAERREPCLVASVEIRNREIHCFIFAKHEPNTDALHLNNLSFGDNEDEVILQLDTLTPEHLVRRYRYHDGLWELVTTKRQDKPLESDSEKKRKGDEDLRLIVQQTLNDPPTLWVASNRMAKSRQLWDPNPQFKHIEFGNVTVYRWKDKSGYEWTGGLVKPVGYVPGKRYPLVIQTYMFYDGEFMTDGTDPTAFAARELASAGMVVLQIQRKSVHTFDDAEAQEHLEGYRSAIERLSNDGLIDPRKVGMVGFSWTCWYVENALIKEPKLFAAATVADGVIHSYMDYLVAGVSNPTIQEQDDRIIGARPFGSGLEQWMQMAPGFNLDKVQTPLRIEAMAPMSILEEWEIYSSLRMQGKPVDLIYFPFGTHIHQKPLERFESQQGDVDWFRFWLEGYEDLDPAKRPEYKRWEKLREQALSGSFKKPQ